MNIFWLDQDVEKIPELLCDSHLNKMILEHCQLLSTAHHILDADKAITGIYKSTHKNHPCAIWARESEKNYSELWKYTAFMFKEYEYRRERIHGCFPVFTALNCLPVGLIGNKESKIEKPQCMPDEFKISGDVVGAYRKYYLHKMTSTFKRPMTWTKRNKPEFLCV